MSGFISITVTRKKKFIQNNEVNKKQALVRLLQGAVIKQ